ncbi:MAG: DUF2304 domain-containing protein [Lentisphaerae bacterium]|jgi:hypothetical protein|nr:DUF2304 domain-containing protein [Lentisphaerota bacterium]
MQPETAFVIARTITGVLGVIALYGSTRYMFRKKLGASFPLLFLLFGIVITLLAVTIFPNTFYLFMPVTRMGRIRLAVAILTVFILLVTFESIRRTHLKERYALLWIIPCGIVLILTAFENIMDWIRGTFGMEYASTMVAVVFLCVMAAVYVISLNISKYEKDITKLSQKCAILEARLRELEKENKK